MYFVVSRMGQRIGGMCNPPAQATSMLLVYTRSATSSIEVLFFLLCCPPHLQPSPWLRSGTTWQINLATVVNHSFEVASR